MSLKDSLKAMDEGRLGEVIRQEQQRKAKVRAAQREFFERHKQEIFAALDEAILYGTGRREPLGVIIARS